MPLPDRSRKQRDENELAKSIVDRATGEPGPDEEAGEDQPKRNPVAVDLGRLGGQKGGPARAKDKNLPDHMRDQPGVGSIWT